MGRWENNIKTDLRDVSVDLNGGASSSVMQTLWRTTSAEMKVVCDLLGMYQLLDMEVGVLINN
jgi:hypothetical protein